MTAPPLAPAGCRPADDLRRLLAGDSDPALELHVEGCARCQAELSALTAPPGPVRSVADSDLARLERLKAAPPADLPDPATAPDEPPVLARYEILGELGRGGMGVVYKARQRSLGRTVALKMILAGGTPRGEAAGRFRREAETVARLQHPNIVGIYDIGEQNGRLFLALEFVDGASLAQKLAGGPLPPAEAARTVEVLAWAVHAVHDQGVVHRDLKPANVLLTADGVPKITDFGLAKLLEEGRTAVTVSGALLGTPGYMAPEQARPAPAGVARTAAPAADIWSLGAILYECLTGRPPFRADTPLGTVLQLLQQEPDRPTTLAPGVPRDLEVICLKCLEKKPERRYGSAAALAADLGRFRAGAPIAARPGPLWERATKWVRRRPYAVAAVAAPTLAFALAAGMWHEAEVRAGLESEARHLANARAEAEGAAYRAEVAARRDAERREALLRIDCSLDRCDQGLVHHGLLELADALTGVPDDDDDLQRLIRRNLAAWRYRAVPVRHVLRHPEQVAVLAYAPDGGALAVGGSDGTARLWDVQTGEPLGPPLRFGSAVTVAAVGPCGRVALGGSNGTARVWDGTTGRMLGEPMRHGATVAALAFRPGGELLSVTEDGAGRLWDAATAAPLGPPVRYGNSTRAVTTTADGARVATADPAGNVRVWDAASGASAGPAMPHPGTVVALALAPDGALLATACGYADDGITGLRLWNVADGHRVGFLNRYQGAVTKLALGPGGKQMLAAGPRGRAFLDESPGWHGSVWLSPSSRAAMKASIVRVEHWDQISAVAVAPDGRTFASTSRLRRGARAQAEVKIFQLPPDQDSGPTYPQPSAVTALATAPGGRRVAVGGQDRTARLWDAAGAPAGPPLPHGGPVRVAAFSPDGSALATGAPDGLRLWDAEAGARRLGPIHCGGEVRSIAFSPDGQRVLAAGLFSAPRWRNAATGEPCGPPLQHRGPAPAAAVSPDGRRIVTGSSDGVARLWDAETGEPLGEPMRHLLEVHAVAFAPDGRSLLSGSRDRTAVLWDAATGRPLLPPFSHADAVIAVAFSPDGALLATVCTEGTARLWDKATGERIGAPLLRSTTAMAFTPDGRTWLAGGSGGIARRWAVPEPVPGDFARVRLWAEATTGHELRPNGQAERLDPKSFEERRAALDAVAP